MSLNLSGRGITSWDEVIQAIQKSGRGPYLKDLHLQNNKISSWKGCDLLPESLLWLFLGGNQISSWEGCSSLPKYLEHLYLDNNQISSWEGCGSLPKSLKKLYLYHNWISFWEGCSSLPKYLEMLDLTNNQISSWEGCDLLPKSLLWLLLGGNQIFSWENCGSLPKSLESLHLNNNQISSWDHFRLDYLRQLYISGNPLYYDSVKFKHIKAAYPIKLYFIRKRILHKWIVRFRVRRLALILELNKDCPMLEDFRLYLS